ncbi:MAG: metal ABC transporter solute-binding protein, Zn/Mn family [Phycisphaerales bacterium]
MSRMSVWMVLGVLVCAAVSTSARGEPRKAPYRAVCTVAMVGDIVSHVAGERAEVRSLIGSGVDPHLYKATRDDVAALLKADIVFYNGLMLEGKMEEALHRAEKAGRRVVAVSEKAPADYLMLATQEGKQFDPHVWMDPTGWMHATRAVIEGLVAFDPEREEEYRARGEAYLKELEALREYAARTVATIPEGRRVLVTSHDAFGYFGRAFGLEVMGVQGISTVSEAGLGDVERLIGVIVDRDVPSVFVETTVSERTIRALVEGCAAKGRTVTIGGSLFSDAMGAPGTYEGTYVGMIDHNVTTIVRALGGEAPARGMQGKLSDDAR